MDQLKRLFSSRKFWALLAGLATIAAGYSTGAVDAWHAVQATIGAMAAYSLSIAIVDGGEAQEPKP